MFASCWRDFDTVCLATALHRLGKLELGRDYYDFLATQPDFVRLLTMIGAQECCFIALAYRFTATCSGCPHNIFRRRHSRTGLAVLLFISNPRDTCSSSRCRRGDYTISHRSQDTSCASSAGERLSDFTARNISNTVRISIQQLS